MRKTKKRKSTQVWRTYDKKQTNGYKPQTNEQIEGGAVQWTEKVHE
jgi:hypothetical protein